MIFVIYLKGEINFFNLVKVRLSPITTYVSLEDEIPMNTKGKFLLSLYNYNEYILKKYKERLEGNI